MKKTFVLLLFVCSASIVFAQNEQQQKIDSVCQLVKKYWNEKNADKIYEMAGELFRQQLSPENFKKVCSDNLFPLGEMKETIFENFENGVSKCKAVFASANLSFFLSLDKNGKIETFLFKPYTK
jgi:hypothetical protein